MRWICPKCGNSWSLALEDCPHCASQPAPEAPPQPKAGRPAGPIKVSYGLPPVKWAQIRRGIEVVVVLTLFAVTIYMVLLWAWPNLIP